MWATDPHRSLEELGLDNVQQAYYATKVALWCYLVPGWSIDKVTIAPGLSEHEQQIAERILAATKDIYNRGSGWTDTLIPGLTVSADQDQAYEVQIDGQAYLQQVDTIDMKAMREELKAIERLRKAADQLARQEQDKFHDWGPDGKGYGVLPTPCRCVAFHDTTLHRKTAVQVSPYGGSTLIYRTGRCASQCGPASAPAHRPQCGR